MKQAGMLMPASEHRLKTTTTDKHFPRTRRPFQRHDVKAILPDLVGRVRAGEFTRLDDIATAFGVDNATASRWKERAVVLGLIDARTWRCALLAARLSREMAA